MPINRNNLHWILAASKPGERTIAIYDFISGRNRDVGVILQNFAEEVSQNDWNLVTLAASEGIQDLNLPLQ